MSYLQSIPFSNTDNLEVVYWLLYSVTLYQTCTMQSVVTFTIHTISTITESWAITAYNIKMLSKIREVTLVKLQVCKFIICKFCGEIYLLVLISHKIIM